jgi:hypothetical protein
MQPELSRKDVLGDDLMMAPMVLTKDFEKFLGVLKQVADVGKKVGDSLGGSGSLPKAKDDTEKLTKAQQELLKVQNAIQTALAKENDEYIKYKKELDDVNKRLKEKTTLGDKDAKTIEKQNASINELSAALAKNRNEYSKLRTEEERNTKAGKDLLAVIQKQDKEFKELRVSMGQAQDNVGNYASAVQGLDGVTGGVIGRFKMLGSQLLLLAGNPFILGLSGFVALLYALGSSVKTFFTATGDGEDMLARQTAVWNQFFNTIKKGWSDVGKSIAEFAGEGTSKKAVNTLISTLEATIGAFPIVALVLEKIRKDFNNTADAATKLADAIDDIQTRQARNIIDKSEKELQYNELIYKSQQKNLYTDEERLSFRERALKIKEDELAIEKLIASDNARAVLTEVALGHAMTQAQIDRIDFRRDYDALDKEFTGDEMKRIAEAYAQVNNLEAQFFGEQKKNAANISALKEEMYKDQLDRAAKSALLLHEIDKKAMDEEIRLIQQEVIQGNKTKLEGDKQINALRKAMADDLVRAQIDGIKKAYDYEKLRKEDQIIIDKKIADLQIQLTEATYDEIQDIEVKGTKITTESIIRAWQQVAMELTNLFQTLSNNRLAQIDAEGKAIEDKLNHQLKIVGDNEDAKAQLERNAEKRRMELEKRRAAELKRAAIFEKANAIIQATINTAVAVTKLLDRPGLAIAAGIAGALQVASIVAQKIPQYEVGTENHPGGLAIVGEKGSELISTNGRLSLSPGMPTMMNLPKGTEVIPHEDTMRMLALAGMGDFKNSSNKPTVIFNSKEIVQAIKEQKFPEPPDYLSIGSEMFKVKKLKDGSVKYIRSKSLSS